MKVNLIVFGTRPELIKLIPIILEIRKRKKRNRFKIICTNQHKELIDDLLEIFEIIPDKRLPLNNCHQSVSETLSSIIKELQQWVQSHINPINYVIAQGDTTSSLGAAMVAFLNNIPFAHIEAGLRTFDQENPFPEEYFRKIITLSADIHFTPTKKAKENLLCEKVPEWKIIHTGNTIVDVMGVLQKTTINRKNESIKKFLKSNNNIIVTCHRRENQNENFNILIDSIEDLAVLNPELNFIWISHLAPFVHNQMKKLSLKKTSNISVVPPITIFELIDLYKCSKMIITDSGGIQEEAVSFNVPTIVFRDKTERMEAVKIGNSIVVGNSGEKLKAAFNKFLEKKGTVKENPFGDGRAAIRIMDFFEKFY